MSEDLVVVQLDGLGLPPHTILVHVESHPDKIGNILIPQTTQSVKDLASEMGVVKLVGKFIWEFDQEHPTPHIGDRVTFTRYAGTNVKGDDGRTYKMLNEKDIGMFWKKKEARVS